MPCTNRSSPPYGLTRQPQGLRAFAQKESNRGPPHEYCTCRGTRHADWDRPQRAFFVPGGAAMTSIAPLVFAVVLTVVVMLLIQRPRLSTPATPDVATQAYLDGVQVGYDAAHAGLQTQFRAKSVLFGTYASDGVFAGSYIASHKRGVRPLFGKEGLTVTDASATPQVWAEGMQVSAGMLKRMPDGSYRQFVSARDGVGYELQAVQS